MHFFVQLCKQNDQSKNFKVFRALESSIKAFDNIFMYIFSHEFRIFALKMEVCEMGGNFRFQMDLTCSVWSLSLIGSIRILTYRMRGSWVYLPYLFTNCVTTCRSCDLFEWFIQTWIGLTWIDVMTRHWNSSMTWERDKLFKKIFLLYTQRK